MTTDATFAAAGFFSRTLIVRPARLAARRASTSITRAIGPLSHGVSTSAAIATSRWRRATEHRLRQSHFSAQSAIKPPQSSYFEEVNHGRLQTISLARERRRHGGGNRNRRGVRVCGDRFREGPTHPDDCGNRRKTGFQRNHV